MRISVTEKLTTTSHKMAEVLYKANSAQAAAGTPEGAPTGEIDTRIVMGR